MYVAPSEPLNVTAMSINSTSVLIMWEQPESPNGILRFYRVTYTIAQPSDATSATVSTTGNSTSVIIGGLEPFTAYRVSVVGMTVEEGPPSEVVMIMTNESGRYNTVLLIHMYICTLLLVWLIN